MIQMLDIAWVIPRFARSKLNDRCIQNIQYVFVFRNKIWESKILWVCVSVCSMSPRCILCFHKSTVFPFGVQICSILGPRNNEVCLPCASSDLWYEHTWERPEPFYCGFAALSAVVLFFLSLLLLFGLWWGRKEVKTCMWGGRKESRK